MSAAAAAPGAPTVRAAPELPGGDHEERAGLGGQVVHRLAHRVGAVGRVATEAHADHLRTGVGGPLHARDDGRAEAGATVVEHLADQQLRTRGDALASPVGRRPAAGDGGGHVGAVAVPVAGAAAAGEVLRLGDPTGQVGMGGVDTGVEHRHLHAGTVPAGRPGGRGADLRHAVLQRRADPPVQPDTGDASTQPGRGGSRGPAGRRTGERGPQAPEGALADPQRGAVDALQRPGVSGTGKRLDPPGRLLLVANDQRQRALRSVAVSVGGQLLHVEQVGVEDPARDVGQGVAGQHPQPAVDLQGLEDDPLAPGSRTDGGGDPARRRGRELDLVAGDQGDADGCRVRGGRARCGAGGPGGRVGGRRCGDADHQRADRADGEPAWGPVHAMRSSTPPGPPSVDEGRSESASERVTRSLVARRRSGDMSSGGQLTSTDCVRHGHRRLPRHPCTGRPNLATSRSVNGRGRSRTMRTGRAPRRTVTRAPGGRS